jgi:hypothetical protein
MHESWPLLQHVGTMTMTANMMMWQRRQAQWDHLDDEVSSGGVGGCPGALLFASFFILF